MDLRSTQLIGQTYWQFTMTTAMYKGQASFDYGFPHFTSDSKWRWLQLVLFTITRAEQLVSTKCTTLLFQCHRIASSDRLM